MRFKESYRYFCAIENFTEGKILKKKKFSNLNHTLYLKFPIWPVKAYFTSKCHPHGGAKSILRRKLSSNLQYKTHQIPKLICFSSRLAVVFVQSIEARCLVENEDVVGAAPTGDAPTTSEWSTSLLPTKVRLILETWWYVKETTPESAEILNYDITFLLHSAVLRYVTLWSCCVTFCYVM